MSENKKRMTIIREDISSADNNTNSKSQYQVHHKHRSQRSKEAYKKKHPIKFFFFGSKERRLRTAFFGIVILLILLILVLYPKLFAPFSNKSSSEGAICMRTDCNKEVSRTGDTSYCTSHSSRCEECNCYIDPYAHYCRDCDSRINSPETE